MSSDFRILVAIDLKAGTDRLLAEAQRYGLALNAVVDIIHVAPPDPDFVGYIKNDNPAEKTQDNLIRDFRSENIADRTSANAGLCYGAARERGSRRTGFDGSGANPGYDSRRDEQTRCGFAHPGLSPSQRHLSPLVWRHRRRCDQAGALCAACHTHPRLGSLSEGGIYALLGPYAVAAASKECRLQSSKLVDPVVTRHIALAMSRHGNLTLACRTVMQITREIAKSGAAGLRRSCSGSWTILCAAATWGAVRIRQQS